MPTQSIFETLTESFGRDYIRGSLARHAESADPSINLALHGICEVLRRTGAPAEAIENVSAVFDLAIAQAVAQGAARQALAMMEHTTIDYDVCKFVHENTLPTSRPEPTGG